MYCTECRLLEVEGHPKTSQKPLKKASRPQPGRLRHQKKRSLKLAHNKNHFFRRGPSGRFQLSRPGPGKWDPIYIYRLESSGALRAPLILFTLLVDHVASTHGLKVTVVGGCNPSNWRRAQTNLVPLHICKRKTVAKSSFRIGRAVASRRPCFCRQNELVWAFGTSNLDPHAMSCKFSIQKRSPSYSRVITAYVIALLGS